MGFNPVSEGVLSTLSLAAEELPEKYTPYEISTRESSMENAWLRKSCVSNIATHVILSYPPGFDMAWTRLYSLASVLSGNRLEQAHEGVRLTALP